MYAYIAKASPAILHILPKKDSVIIYLALLEIILSRKLGIITFLPLTRSSGNRNAATYFVGNRTLVTLL